MTRAKLWVSVLASCCLASCGGSSSSSLETHPAATGTARVELRIAWPSSRAIPAGTKAILITVSGPDINVPFMHTIERTDSATSTVELDVPAGPDRLFSALALDEPPTTLARAERASDGGAEAGRSYNAHVLALGNTFLETLPSSDVPTPLRITLEPVAAQATGMADGDLLMTGQVIRSPDNPAEGQIVLSGMLTAGASLNHLTAENLFVSLHDISTVGKPEIPLPIRNFTNLSDATTVRQDIVFVLDTTGSMRNAIAGVRDSVRSFAARLASDGRDLRLGAVTFGDYVNAPSGSYEAYDDEGAREVFDLTSNVESFRDFIAAQSAVGGGDDPENGLDAIIHAVDHLSWREGAQRILILITDSTVHQAGDGTSYTDQTLASTIEHLAGQYALYVVSPNSSISAYPTRNAAASNHAAGHRGQPTPPAPRAALPAAGRQAALVPLVAGDVLNASIGANEVQWYSLDLVSDRQYYITGRPAFNDGLLQLHLLDDNKDSLALGETFGASSRAVIRLTARRTGRYYVAVTTDVYIGSRDYSISLAEGRDPGAFSGRDLPAKELANFGGGWIELPSNGRVDLDALQITDLIFNGYRFTYPLLWHGRSPASQQELVIRIRDGSNAADLNLIASF